MNGCGEMVLTVRDVMVTPVIVVGSQQTAQHAAKVLSLNGIGCLVVVENELVVGILTEKDLINRVIVEKRDPEETLVGDIMSKPPIVARPELTLEDAIRVMFTHRIKKLVVVEGDGEKRRLAGLVTLTDIARVNQSLMETLRRLFDERGEAPPKSIEKTMSYYIV